MRSVVRRAAIGAIALSLMVSGAATANGSRQSAHRTSTAAGANVGWPQFGNTSDNTHFSSLTQINSSNVSQLGVAWTAAEGGHLVTFETDPVVVNGVMYYTTNADQVRAVDAATGKLLWQYTPKVNFYIALAGGGGGVPTNRGVTVANGKVYLLTFDDQLIALQASTGEVLWRSVVANANDGYSESSPATYWNGLLFVGSAESDAGLRGFVAAYDANTGKQVWRFYTVPPAGQGWMPKQPSPVKGGGDVWMPLLIDTRTGILYFGTGNPFPDFDPSKRPGCDPWVDAIVAVNARTGKFLWAHSEVCNDAWDYDSHQEPLILDVMIHGKKVHAVGHGNKSGLYFIYDAATGKVLAQTGHLGKWTTPHIFSQNGVYTCPGVFGGLEFSPPAYSPLTNAIYAPGLDACHVIGVKHFGFPKKTSGWMAAIDPSTGKLRWKTAVLGPLYGGALATAGNLVFAGSLDTHLYAFDARSGKILWKPSFGLPFAAAPVTYEVNGTQYIAIAAGGPSPIAFLNPKSPQGGTLVVLKLKGKPITKLPIVVGAFTSGLSQVVSLKGLTKINQWEYVDPVRHRVVIKLVAALTANNSGFNFDGYAKGKANFIVPSGWVVSVIFTNKQGLPHSVAVVPTLKLTAQTVPLMATPNPVQGISAGLTQYAGFNTGSLLAQPGKYYLVCMVPGHIQAGMWDYLTISTTAKSPSIKVS